MTKHDISILGKENAFDLIGKVAGHQFVKIYSIRGDEVPELVLDSYQEGESQELTEMFKTFEKGTAVKFNKKLSK